MCAHARRCSRGKLASLVKPSAMYCSWACPAMLRQESQCYGLATIMCRYAGTDVAVMTSWQEGSDPAAAFAAAYQREFGFVLDRPVVVDDVRVRATGRAAALPHIQVC